MLAKILKMIDIFPGWKTNTGAIVLILTSLLQLQGVDNATIKAIAELATALLAFGLTMKNIRDNKK